MDELIWIGSYIVNVDSHYSKTWRQNSMISLTQELAHFIHQASHDQFPADAAEKRKKLS